MYRIMVYANHGTFGLDTDKLAQYLYDKFKEPYGVPYNEEPEALTRYFAAVHAVQDFADFEWDLPSDTAFPTSQISRLLAIFDMQCEKLLMALLLDDSEEACDTRAKYLGDDHREPWARFPETWSFRVEDF